MIDEFMEFQFRHWRDQPRPEKTRRWISDDTGILYVITLGDRYTLNDSDGKRLYDNCYRTGLDVDLYGGVETDLGNLQKGFRANFCRSDSGDWALQLPGRK